jgi:FAD:protein FMN transferase
MLTFDAIGTGWTIDIYEDISAEREAELFSVVKHRIDIFDKIYSRFRSDSLVTAMSQKAGEYEFPEDGELLFDIYKKLFDITDGRLTPLIGQVLVDAGYDAAYSLTQKKELEKPEKWEDVMSYTHPLLTLKKPALLDFGAAGKGYLIDLVGQVLKENGIQRFCIDAGGDILHRNPENTPLKIGLEHPDDFSKVIGIVEISNKSLCGSAGSRRKWANFNHIIDPFELSSPHHILATWVIADSTIIADALASCLFFVSSEVLLVHYKFDYVVLRADYTVEASPNFPGELFTS